APVRAPGVVAEFSSGYRNFAEYLPSIRLLRDTGFTRICAALTTQRYSPNPICLSWPLWERDIECGLSLLKQRSCSWRQNNISGSSYGRSEGPVLFHRRSFGWWAEGESGAASFLHQSGPDKQLFEGPFISSVPKR